MKKKNFKSLRLNKKSISKINSNSKTGGVCSNTANAGVGASKVTVNVPKCFSRNDALSCQWICAAGPSYTHTWSES